MEGALLPLLAVSASQGPLGSKGWIPGEWGGGTHAVGLSAAGPSSGVPALHGSSLWVSATGISVGVPGLRSLFSESLVWGSLVSDVPTQLSRCLRCGSLVWGVHDAASPYSGCPGPSLWVGSLPGGLLSQQEEWLEHNCVRRLSMERC